MSVGRLVCWSVCHTFPKGWEVTLYPSIEVPATNAFSYVATSLTGPPQAPATPPPQAPATPPPTLYYTSPAPHQKTSSPVPSSKNPSLSDEVCFKIYA